MTLHTPGMSRTAYPDFAYTPTKAPPTRPLDQLSARDFSKKLVVFNPAGKGIDQLFAQAGQQMGQLASLDTVRRVVSLNPDSLWAIARRSRYNWNTHQGEGFVALLVLNAQGRDELISGRLDTSNPDSSLLVAQSEKPAAIYIWAMFLPGVLAGGVPLVLEKFSSPLYQDVSLYARAATDSGRQFMETVGFRLGAKIDGRAVPHLHVFPRGEDANQPGPAYDTYHRSPKAKGLSVTVARTVDDLTRVMAIRSAVYIAEQDCPYEEEFDGNDLSATHLLGYIGNEPAGCLRVRFFADFAKIERLAVRHEFRQTRLSFQLVKAGIELARVKGYRRLYGHAQKRLVNFWSRFGFHTFEGGSELVFSDFDYVEMVMEADRHPQAITIGVDPYVIIRPEGRWHVPSVLEQSSARKVTRPSVDAVSAQ